MLGKLGCDIDVAVNGLEALKALQNKPYDVVLMDVHMPEMDGLEATRRIRDVKSAVLNHAIPVIAMTASAMKEDRDSCLAAGMNDYISKPVNPSELARVLKIYSDLKTGEKESPVENAGVKGSEIFDKTILLEKIGGDEAICAEILQVFIADIPLRIKEIEEALAQNDLPTLKRGAHTIKGASGNVGALKLQAIALQLETAAGAGVTSSAREMLNNIKTEFEKISQAIGADHE